MKEQFLKFISNDEFKRQDHSLYDTHVQFKGFFDSITVSHNDLNTLLSEAKDQISFKHDEIWYAWLTSQNGKNIAKLDTDLLKVLLALEDSSSLKYLVSKIKANTNRDAAGYIKQLSNIDILEMPDNFRYSFMVNLWIDNETTIDELNILQTISEVTSTKTTIIAKWLGTPKGKMLLISEVLALLAPLEKERQAIAATQWISCTTTFDEFKTILELSEDASNQKDILTAYLKNLAQEIDTKTFTELLNSTKLNDAEKFKITENFILTQLVLSTNGARILELVKMLPEANKDNFILYELNIEQIKILSCKQILELFDILKEENSKAIFARIITLALKNLTITTDSLDDFKLLFEKLQSSDNFSLYLGISELLAKYITTTKDTVNLSKLNDLMVLRKEDSFAKALYAQYIVQAWLITDAMKDTTLSEITPVLEKVGEATTSDLHQAFLEKSTHRNITLKEFTDNILAKNPKHLMVSLIESFLKTENGAKLDPVTFKQELLSKAEYKNQSTALKKAYKTATKIDLDSLDKEKTLWLSGGVVGAVLAVALIGFAIATLFVPGLQLVALAAFALGTAQAVVTLGTALAVGGAVAVGTASVGAIVASQHVDQAAEFNIGKPSSKVHGEIVAEIANKVNAALGR